MERPQELFQIFRNAVQCNACFEDRTLARGFIKVAQLRPIGPKYWTSLVKVLVLMINPGRGIGDDNHREGEKQLRAFANGQGSIDQIFHAQQVDFHNWGRGKFLPFYEEMGLDFDDIALANVAWCSEMRDKPPARMLNECFGRHTTPLVRALTPDVILLSGSKIEHFKTLLAGAAPKVRVLPTLHFSNRESDNLVQEQARLIRAELNAMKSAKALERRNGKK